MADKKQKAGMELTGKVQFYENPQPLSKDKHEKFGVKPVQKPFTFMEKSHSVPLAAPEFISAASSYPIIFLGDDKPTPFAVLGVRQNENLFVTEGVFNHDFYLPAFARRYPFVLASDKGNDQFIVCVDEAAECVTNKKPATNFFEKGEASKFTKDAFEFLQAFERDNQATQTMAARLKELDLFEVKEMNFQGQNADGSLADKQKIAEYYAVSQEKLSKLDDKMIVEFSKNGYLPAIYAHLQSLGNWQRLVNFALRKGAAAEA